MITPQKLVTENHKVSQKETQPQVASVFTEPTILVAGGGPCAPGAQPNSTNNGVQNQKGGDTKLAFATDSPDVVTVADEVKIKKKAEKKEAENEEEKKESDKVAEKEVKKVAAKDAELQEAAKKAAKEADPEVKKPSDKIEPDKPEEKKDKTDKTDKTEPDKLDLNKLEATAADAPKTFDVTPKSPLNKPVQFDPPPPAAPPPPPVVSAPPAPVVPPPPPVPAPRITNFNATPTGNVTIDGALVQGNTLRVSDSIADANGIGLITFQWKADGIWIGEGNTYTLTSYEVGKKITVEASYTDDAGTNEKVISGESSPVNATGGDGDDTLTGGVGDDSIDGGGGNDTIRSGGGNDTLTGGTGNDTFDVGPQDNFALRTFAIFAESLPFTTITDLGNGADILNVAPGYTVYATLAGNWNATFSQNDGEVTIYANGYDVDLSGDTGLGHYTVINSNSAGDISLNLIKVIGSNNDDTIVGGDGNDFINGGGGNDTVIFSGSSSDYMISKNLDGSYSFTDTVTNRDGTDTLINIQNIKFLAEDKIYSLTDLNLTYPYDPIADSISSFYIGPNFINPYDNNQKHLWYIFDGAQLPLEIQYVRISTSFDIASPSLPNLKLYWGTNTETNINFESDTVTDVLRNNITFHLNSSARVDVNGATLHDLVVSSKNATASDFQSFLQSISLNYDNSTPVPDHAARILFKVETSQDGSTWQGINMQASWDGSSNEDGLRSVILNGSHPTFYNASFNGDLINLDLKQNKVQESGSQGFPLDSNLPGYGDVYFKSLFGEPDPKLFAVTVRDLQGNEILNNGKAFSVIDTAIDSSVILKLDCTIPNDALVSVTYNAPDGNQFNNVIQDWQGNDAQTGTVIAHFEPRGITLEVLPGAVLGLGSGPNGDSKGYVNDIGEDEPPRIISIDPDNPLFMTAVLNGYYHLNPSYVASYAIDFTSYEYSRKSDVVVFQLKAGSDYKVGDIVPWNKVPLDIVNIISMTKSVMVSHDGIHDLQSFNLSKETFTGGSISLLDYANAGKITRAWGDDFFIGGNFNDKFFGSFGNDTISGGAGNDWLDGGAGSNILTGGLGDDTFNVNNIGENGDVDTITDLGNDDILKVNAGSAVNVTLGADWIASNNSFVDSSVKVFISTNGWKVDLSQLNSGNFFIQGAVSNDTIVGSVGDDYIYGFDGNDTITGGSGDNTIIGGRGDDIIVGGGHVFGDTVVYSGTFEDYKISLNLDGSYKVVDTRLSNDNEGTDSLADIQYIEFNDGMLYDLASVVLTVSGTNDSETLYSVPGRVLIMSGSFGTDQFFVGQISSDPVNAYITDLGLGTGKPDETTNETLIVFNPNDSVEATLLANWHASSMSKNNGTATIHANGFNVDVSEASQGLNGFTIDNTDSIGQIISAQGIIITGSDKDDTIYGGSGDDIITGGGGDDFIIGGGGNNTAVFSGSRADYTISKNLDGSYNFTDTVTNRDGTDKLIKIQSIKFLGESNHAPTLISHLHLTRHEFIAENTTTPNTPFYYFNMGRDGSNNLVNGALDPETLSNQIGIAITGCTGITDGIVQYSHDNGATWVTVPNTYVSEEHALLFLGTDLLRYTPPANTTGDRTITFHAWDGTGGYSSGTYVDLTSITSTGGSSPFSSNTSSETLTIITPTDVNGTAGNDLLTATPGITNMHGLNGDDMFIVQGGTANITDLGLGADDINVSSGALLNATLAGDWTPTSQSKNNGTTIIHANGFNVDLSMANQGLNGFSIDNIDSNNAVNIIGSNNNDTFQTNRSDTLTGGGGDDIFQTLGGDSAYVFIKDLSGHDIIKLETMATVSLASDWTATSDSYGGRPVFFVNDHNINLAQFNRGTDGLMGWITNLGNSKDVTLQGIAHGDIYNNGTKIQGGFGNDTLIGGTGDDRLYGEEGNNTLIGGEGKDIFVFDTAPNTTNNIIADFNSGSDKLMFDIRGERFDKLVPGIQEANGSIQLDSNDLLSGSTVDQSSSTGQHILYNSSSGALFYDQDGEGVNAAIEIAKLYSDLTSHPLKLEATDFNLSFIGISS